MLTVLVNYANKSTFWLKGYITFKHIIFDEGVVWVVWHINFNVGRVETLVPVTSSETGDHPLSNLFCRWTIFEFLGIWVPIFHSFYAVSVTHKRSFLFTIILNFGKWSDRIDVTSKYSEFMNAVFLAIPYKMRCCVV